MKHLPLLIGLLFSFSLDAQMSVEEEDYVDSLKKVVKSAKHDSVKINAWIAWDDVIWYYDPDLDLELNNKVKSTSSKNLKNKSLSAKEKMFFQMNYAKSMHNMGVIYFGKGNYAKAINLFTESLTLREEIGDLAGAGASINNIGNIYLEQGNNDKAKEYYERSLKIFRKLDDKRGLGSALGNLGLISANQKKYNDALKYQEESYDIREKLGDKQGMAISLSNIGQIYNELGKYSKALEYYEKGKRLYEEMGDGYGVALSLIDYGNTHLLRKEYQKAIQVCEEAVVLAKEREAPKIQRDAYHTMYQGYEALGNKLLAFEKYKLYVELSDSLASEENQKEIIRQQYKYEYEVQAAQDSVARDKERKIEGIKIEKKNQQLTFLWIGLGIFVIFAIFIFNRFRITNKQKVLIEDQKSKVESANKALEEKNKEILDSINYAKRIQNAILPSQTKMDENLKDYFVFYRPKDIVAGDFYWLEKRNNKVIFAVADCTGHGVPGAMVSVVCNNGLNRSVREYGMTDPGEILGKTREIVIQEFEKSKDDVNDGMDIALCSMEDYKLEYAGAHNPLWIIRDGKLLEFKANKQPIGKFHSQETFTTHEIDLNMDDTLYLFTDGYADQFGGDEDRKFMVKSFKELLLSIQDKSLSEQARLLESEFDRWKGENEQIDDVCILGVRV